MRCKVDAARRVRIPSELCRTLDIRPGDEMTVSLRGGRIEMKKVENRCLFCGSDENLTAYENLKVRTTMLGLPDNRIDEVLHIVRLTDTGKKRAGQFSLGMKQRLGIAIALLNNPQLLILDEPTNGLDPVGIEELRELIRSFPAKGITVILSSHILSEVQQIADHVGIIAGGVLGYENELRNGETLEQLFMDVVKRHHKEV